MSFAFLVIIDLSAYDAKISMDFNNILFLFSFTINAELPFGKMPLLEVDGQILHQSHAINQFLGKRFGKLSYLS